LFKLEKYYSATETAKVWEFPSRPWIRYEEKGIFPQSKRNALNVLREYTKGEIEKLKGLWGAADNRPPGDIFI